MQQRRLRLGDILDDYCPRERRITNHVVVAMIEDDVRQTRCTTCDAEHEYKQAKAPAPRRKKTGALSPDGPEDARPRAVAAAPTATPQDPIADESDSPNDLDAVPSPVIADAALLASDDAPEGDPEVPEDDRVDDDGPVHRRLIRATLPRPEGHVPERKEPEFTMRQPDRHGQRSRQHRAARQANAHGQQGGHNRFGSGQRHGAGASGQGQRQGNRPGQPSSNRGGGHPGGQNRGPGRKRGR